ncbi:hypothetical protein [Actinoplanes palleronii]|uniref:Uncharacterized protein n=1 Tax=Actinoplanes palleronii TaxID=113570 RepID=A0ABQ4BFR5_9ACTN|nr:hypothetical protein [Actinoplanes palleronii]GIE69432.1 hypothetical protein Apa02nite_055400 [Actinoplanes palleronii]
MRSKLVTKFAIVTAGAAVITMGVAPAMASAAAPHTRVAVAVSQVDTRTVAEADALTAAGLPLQTVITALRQGGLLLQAIVGAVSPEAGLVILQHANSIADFLEEAQQVDRAGIIAHLVGLGVLERTTGIVADVLLLIIQG